MTISSVTAKVQYTGNSIRTEHSFSPIVIQSADQLEVWHIAPGATTLLTEGTGISNYSLSVSSFPGTGTITYPADTVNGTPIPSTEKLIIKRVAALKQEVDLENQGGYFPEVQEDALDLERIIDIQQQEELNRCIRIAIDDELTVTDLTLPSAADRANRYFQFDADGKPTAVTEVEAGSVTISSFAETFLDDTSAAEVITTLSPSDTFTLISTDAGSAVKPILKLWRNSASPADDDFLGEIIFAGEDDGGAEVSYATIKVQATDITDATEDGRLIFSTIIDGTEKEQVYIGPGRRMDLLSEDSGSGAGPSFRLIRDSASPANNDDIGEIVWLGEDSTSAATRYAAMFCEIGNVTDTTENGRLITNLIVDGTEREVWRIGAGSIAKLSSLVSDTSADPHFILDRVSVSPADNDVNGQIIFRGRNDAIVAEEIDYASIQMITEDISDGTEDGYFTFTNKRAGSDVTSLSPGILYTQQVSTSGTSISFTGIPSSARKITVLSKGISTTGTSPIIIQLGDSGGIEATNYTGGVREESTGSASNSIGFNLNRVSIEAETYTIIANLTLMDPVTNTWAMFSSGMEDDGTGNSMTSTGTKALSAAITQLVVTTESGVDTFDAGAINILVE